MDNDNNKRVCAYINLDNIMHNLRLLDKLTKSRSLIMAVIKADAYGHGAIQVAKHIHDYKNLWGFGVATAEEAIELKRSGIHKPVVILGFSFPEAYEQLVKLDIQPAILHTKAARLLSEEAKRQHKTIKLQLKIDTGMNRVGFPDTLSSVEMIREINSLDNVEIEGVFTHFSKSDEADKTYTKEQIRRFDAFLSALKDRGIVPLMKHCSNSAGIIDLEEANYDMVRAGISLYGIYPSDDVHKERALLKPALSLKSHVVFIKDCPKGSLISYGGTFVTGMNTRVATIPVGYGDGYPRSLSNKGYVLIRGEKAPILGRICMDQFMVDVSRIKDVSLFDEVVLVGSQGGKCIPVDELSEISGRFPYEFVCDLGKRIPRVYTGGAMSGKAM